MQTIDTTDPRFAAPLVGISTQQGIGVSDDAGARLARTAPGSEGAFAPVRQAAGPLPAGSGPDIPLNQQSRPPHVEQEPAADHGGFGDDWRPGAGDHNAGGWNTISSSRLWDQL